MGIVIPLIHLIKMKLKADDLNQFILRMLEDGSDVMKMISAGAFISGIIEARDASPFAIPLGILFLLVACVLRTVFHRAYSKKDEQ